MSAELPDPRKEASRWMVGFVVSSVAALAAFVANWALDEVRPGNAWGISFGTAASVLMLGTLAFGVRRRTMSLSSKLRLGRSRAWLHFHIYGGLAFMLLVLMHTGFRLPMGIITNWLFWLSLLTVVSGLFGLFLQKWIPRVLSSGLSVEILYDRIHELASDIRKRAAELAGAIEDPLLGSLYSDKIEPVLEGPQRRWVYLFDVTGGIQSRLYEFNYVRRLLSEAERTRLGELERLFRAKLEIDAHYTLQSLLRTWLYSHVPVSLVATAFLILHLVSVYYW